MASRSSLRWKFFKDTVRLAVVDILGGDVTDAIWQDPNIARPVRPYVSMRVISGPRRTVGTSDDIEKCSDAPDDHIVTVLSTTAGRRNRIRLNGRPFDYTATAAGEEDLARDAWIAGINASDEPVTASISGPAAMLLTPDFAGAVFSILSIPGALATITPNVSTTPVLHHWGTRLFTISFATWTKSVRYQDDAVHGPGALDLASRIESGFELQRIQQMLSDKRVSLWSPVGDTANLGAMASAFNEGRGQADLAFAATSLVTETIDTIENVNLEIQGNPSTVDLVP